MVSRLFLSFQEREEGSCEQVWDDDDDDDEIKREEMMREWQWRC